MEILLCHVNTSAAKRIPYGRGSARTEVGVMGRYYLDSWLYPHRHPVRYWSLFDNSEQFF